MTLKVGSPETITDAEAADDLQFLTYDDLKARRIVHSRSQLSRLRIHSNFPRPIMIGGRAVYVPREVRAFLAAQMSVRK